MKRITVTHPEPLEGGTHERIDEILYNYVRLYVTDVSTVFIKRKAVRKAMSKKQAKQIQVLERQKPNTCGYDEYEYWIDITIDVLSKVPVDVNYGGLSINVIDYIRDVAEAKIKDNK